MAEYLNIDVSEFVENLSWPAMKAFEVKCAANVLMTMLTEGLLADVMFQIEGRCVKAHCCVLASTSSVFHAMFKHGMRERITSIVEIKDMSMEGLQLFLLLLYISASEKLGQMWEFEVAVAKHAREVIHAINKYDVENRFNEILARALPRALTPNNCWDYCRLTSLELAFLLKYMNIFKSGCE